MAKKHKSTFSIFAEAAGLYFSNIGKFVKYMTFPVLGQIFGLSFVFFTAYIYSANIDKIISKYPNINNVSTLIFISVLLTLPGLCIFCKAFWEYIVAYGAVNSTYENLIKSGKIYDYNAHTELIKRRAASFIGLWLIIGFISIAAICPFFFVICAIFAVYFVLAFQVFTFEPELSPVGCLKKSLILIKGNFGKTFVLLLLTGILTYLFIPNLFIKLFDFIGINSFFAKLILPFVNILPEINLQTIGIPAISASDISLFIIQTTVAQIAIQYTLPLRALIWTGWYQELNNSNSTVFSQGKTNKKSTKRPSEKLMENTHKKYSRKIDSNILKRASEKDE